MKKKAMLSEEALALMLSATEEEAASEETVQAAETKEPEIPEVTEPEAADEAPAFDAFQKDFDEFKSEAESKITEAEAKVTEAEAKLAEVTEAAAELKSIVADQISKMRLALKLPPVDLSAMSTETVVAEFHNTKESFVKALPVGSVVPEKKEEKKVEMPVATSLDVSKIKTLGF